MRSGMAAMVLMAAAMGAPAVSRWPLAFSEERKESPPANGQLPAASGSAASAALSLGKAHAASGAPVSAQARLEEARRSRDPALRAMAAFWLDVVESRSFFPSRAVESARQRYLKNNDFDGTVRQLERALSQRLFDWRLHYELGQIYMAKPQFCFERFVCGGKRRTYQSIPYAALHELEMASHLAKTPLGKIAAEAALAKLYMERVREFVAIAKCDCGNPSYFSAAQDYAARARGKMEHVKELQEQYGVKGIPRSFSMTSAVDRVVHNGGMAIVYPSGGERKARSIMRTLRDRNQRLFNPEFKDMPTISLVPLEVKESLPPN